MIVIKRDGRHVTFDSNKIERAINKAFGSLNKPENEIAHKIASEIEAMNKELTVEEIQDIIIKKLMASSHKDVARAYIEYMYLHKMARNNYRELMDAISEKLMATNVQNQNANVDEHSFGGRVGEASDVVLKRYALDYLVSPMARENHLNNEIYIHDLNAYAIGEHNCLSVPIDDLLANGFNVRQTDIRPAKSINTALQLVAVLFQVQSLQQFGGVSATHLDWSMVPYTRMSFYKHYKDGLKYVEGFTGDIFNNYTAEMSIEDEKYKEHYKAYKYALDMTDKETYQAVEGLYHNLNSLQSRSGNQLECVAG